MAPVWAFIRQLKERCTSKRRYLPIQINKTIYKKMHQINVHKAANYIENLIILSY